MLNALQHPQSPDIHDTWLTEKQVESLTGISTSTLQKHRFNGTGLPYVKLSARMIRYSQSAIVRYMHAHEIVPEL